MSTQYKLDSDKNIIDYPMGVDDLGLPKFRDMNDIENGVYNGAILCIIRLILLRKGTYPDHPNMGVDIKGRYRFAFDSELSALQNDIEEQIELYLPEVLPCTVSVCMVQDTDTLKNKIRISIIINEVEYLLMYDVSSNTLEGIKR